MSEVLPSTVRAGGRVLVGNIGSMPGYRAALWIDVNTRVGAAVVANATAGPEPAAVAADMIELVEQHEPHVAEWTPIAEADPQLLPLTGVWYWGARPQLVRLLAGREFTVARALTGEDATRFAPAADGTWTGVEGHGGRRDAARRDAPGRTREPSHRRRLRPDACAVRPVRFHPRRRRPVSSNRTANGDSEPVRAELPPSTVRMRVGLSVDQD